MKLYAAILSLPLWLLKPAMATNRTVMEGIPATAATVYVSTPQVPGGSPGVFFATTAYGGGMPNVAVYVASNVAVGQNNAIVIQSTGGITFGADSTTQQTALVRSSFMFASSTFGAIDLIPGRDYDFQIAISSMEALGAFQVKFNGDSGNNYNWVVVGGDTIGVAFTTGARSSTVCQLVSTTTGVGFAMTGFLTLRYQAGLGNSDNTKVRIDGSLGYVNSGLEPMQGTFFCYYAGSSNVNRIEFQSNGSSAKLNGRIKVLAVN